MSIEVSVHKINCMEKEIKYKIKQASVNKTVCHSNVHTLQWQIISDLLHNGVTVLATLLAVYTALIAIPYDNQRADFHHKIVFVSL